MILYTYNYIILYNKIYNFNIIFCKINLILKHIPNCKTQALLKQVNVYVHFMVKQKILTFKKCLLINSNIKICFQTTYINSSIILKTVKAKHKTM